MYYVLVEAKCNKFKDDLSFNNKSIVTSLWKWLMSTMPKFNVICYISLYLKKLMKPMGDLYGRMTLASSQLKSDLLFPDNFFSFLYRIFLFNLDFWIWTIKRFIGCSVVSSFFQPCYLKFWHSTSDVFNWFHK